VNGRQTADIVVIGGGPAGLAVAVGAAQLGADTVLIERDAMGGASLRHGGAATAALLAAGRRAQAMREAAAFGLGAVEPQVDFAAVMRQVRAVIDTLAPQDSAERLAGLGVRVVGGDARFTGRCEVAAGGVAIRARRLVIATGARPRMPRIAGLDRVPLLTPETIFANDTLPEHLLVVGGGPEALALAQAHRLLGARVSMVAPWGVLTDEDPEPVALLLECLAARGITVRAEPIAEITARAGGVAIRLEAETEPLAGSHLLVAAGGQPALDGLGLEAAGIATDAEGRLALDHRLRTSNRRVYAAGDATGARFAHEALDHAGIVLRNALFRLPARTGTRPPVRVVFTAPELAQAGLTEAEARARHGRITILRWPFFENDRAQAERTATGLVKLVARRDGRVLGATILGERAGELIPLWALAIARGLRLSAVAGLDLPYPTMGEASKRAAASFDLPRLAGARHKWLVRLLARFG